MRIDVTRYEPHTLSLRPFKFFFQQLHWFLQLGSCFIKWYKKERSINLLPLCIHNNSCFETLNLLHVSSCEMFTFCDVLHKTKQKTQSKSWDCAVRTGNHNWPLVFHQSEVDMLAYVCKRGRRVCLRGRAYGRNLIMESLVSVDA